MYVGGAGYVGGGGGGSGGTSDHGELDGLADDDHTQYALADGSRGTSDLSDVTNTLAVASGGTGATTAGGARTNLGALGTSDTAANSSQLNGQAASFYTNASNISSGTLSIARGGTGGSSVVSSRNLFLIPPLYGYSGLRLTPSSSDPLGESSGSSTLYLLPYVSGFMVVMGESGVVEHLYTDGMSFSNASNDLDGASIASSSVYDVFYYEDSSDPYLGLKKWTNATTRATALTRVTGSSQNSGALVLTGATDHLYLGTVRTSSTGNFVSEPGRRYIWNFQNRVRYYDHQRISSPTSYTLGASVTARTWNNANYDEMNHRFVRGLAGGASLRVIATIGVTSNNADFWVGLDGSTQAGAKIQVYSSNPHAIEGVASGVIGYHTLAAYESSPSGASLAVNFGDYAGSTAEGEW